MPAKFEVRSFNRVGIISTNFPKNRGHVNLATPPFRKIFKGLCPDYPWEHAKFEVRSFECFGSRQRLSVILQNRWTQVRGPEHSRVSP